MGGALLAGFFETPILIVSVFTRTSDEEATAKEDEEYAKTVGAGLVGLGLLDAPFRNAPHPNPLVSITLSRAVLAKSGLRFASSFRYIASLGLARTDPQSSLVLSALERTLRDHPGALVVSPLGIGDHPDHLLVANASKRLQASGKSLIFYEDLPYAWRFSPDDVCLQARLFDARLRPTMLDITDVYARKSRNLGAYATQLQPLHRRRTEEHAERLGGGRGMFERVWSLRKSPSGL